MYALNWLCEPKTSWLESGDRLWIDMVLRYTTHVCISFADADGPASANTATSLLVQASFWVTLRLFPFTNLYSVSGGYLLVDVHFKYL